MLKSSIKCYVLTNVWLQYFGKVVFKYLANTKQHVNCMIHGFPKTIKNSIHQSQITKAHFPRKYTNICINFFFEVFLVA